MVVPAQIFINFIMMKSIKKNFEHIQNVWLNNDLNINIVLHNNEEEIKKIIKIQSHVRGMEMRNKIKLKSRNKKLINQNIQNKKEINYETIIVNKIKIFFY